MLSAMLMLWWLKDCIGLPIDDDDDDDSVLLSTAN